MEKSRTVSVGELIYLSFLTCLLAIGWLGVTLAEAGLFGLPGLFLGVGVMALLVTAWLQPRFGLLSRVQPRREDLIPAGLLLLTVLLFARPTEHIPLLGDSAIYPNTGALLARTGGLTARYTPLDGLSSEAKELFYVPIEKQLSFGKFEGYQGLLFGAYYVMDADQNQILASRPPLFIVWMGIFYLLFGPYGALYTTPLFGLLGMLGLYFTGRHLFGPKVGLAAALLLVLSLPQIHFARTSYNEILNQALMFGGLAALMAYLHTARPVYLAVAGLAFGETLFTRMDSVLLVVPLSLFVLGQIRSAFKAGYYHGISMLPSGETARKALAFFLIPLGLLWGHALLHTLLVNWPYVYVTLQLLASRFLRELSPWVALGLGAGSFLVGLLVFQGRRPRLTVSSGRQRWAQLAASLAIVALVAYGYFLRSVPESTFHHPHLILPRLGWYVTPVAVWLAVLGAVKLIHRDLRADTALFLTFALTFGSFFLSWQIITPLHPAGLRVQVPEVIPSLLLLVSYALLAWRDERLRVAGVVAVAILLLAFIRLDWPYLGYTEARGAMAVTQDLADRFTNDDVILFEALGERTQVGWFAGTLWSLYGKQALLLSEANPEPTLLAQAVDHWAAQGRQVYFVSQSNPVSSGLELSLEGPLTSLAWRSSIIGQTLTHFPPYIWEFDMRFHIYRLVPASVSSLVVTTQP